MSAGSRLGFLAKSQHELSHIMFSSLCSDASEDSEEDSPS